MEEIVVQFMKRRQAFARSADVNREFQDAVAGCGFVVDILRWREEGAAETSLWVFEYLNV